MNRVKLGKKRNCCLVGGESEKNIWEETIEVNEKGLFWQKETEIRSHEKNQMRKIGT